MKKGLHRSLPAFFPETITFPKQLFALAALLMTAFFANAQENQRLPVMASLEEKPLNKQFEKQAKSGNAAFENSFRHSINVKRWAG